MKSRQMDPTGNAKISEMSPQPPRRADGPVSFMVVLHRRGDLTPAQFLDYLDQVRRSWSAV